LDTKAKIPGSSENARPKPCSLQDRQLRRLKEFGERINRLGADFAVCDLTGEVVVLCPTDASDTEPVQLKQYCLETLKQSTATELRVCRFGRKNPVLSVVLRAEAQNLAVALVKPGPSPGADIDELKEFCSAQKVDYETLQELLSDSVRTDCNCLTGMLNMLAEDFEADLDAQKQTEMVSTELAQTYEELVLLHKLSTNMKVTESDANYLQMACDSLTDIVSVAGIAVLLERTVDDEKQLVVAAGSGLIDVDERMAVLLENRLADEIKNGRDALLDSEVDSPFRYDWPENIQSIIVVPLYGKERGPAHIAEDATGDKRKEHVARRRLADNLPIAVVGEEVVIRTKILVSSGEVMSVPVEQVHLFAERHADVWMFGQKGSQCRRAALLRSGDQKIYPLGAFVGFGVVVGQAKGRVLAQGCAAAGLCLLIDGGSHCQASRQRRRDEYKN